MSHDSERTSDVNVDHQELAKFEALAARWWDPDGEMRTLHTINPLRLDYIERRGGLRDRRVLDVGCGAGLLAEGMAARGASVTGIDLAGKTLEAARLHLAESAQEVEYRQVAVEALAAELPGTFDVVACMEMLEHVPRPEEVVAACARLAAPGGHLFFATINRNPKAFALAIVGAEYLLRMVPRGTHEYAQFIKPSELAGWARGAGLRLEDLTGMVYNPMTGSFRLSGDVDVNYLTHFRRDSARTIHEGAADCR